MMISARVGMLAGGGGGGEGRFRTGFGFKKNSRYLPTVPT